ncbi:MAG: hypothetical protein KGI73_02275 [Patescibacteria group bacterium]|nr:hypothetical protein [Patescibacteria group bacterium]
MSSAKKRKRLVLLDTHAIIHRAYHALPELTSPKGEAVGAVYGLSTMLMRIAKDLKPDYIVATYDLPGPTHRHEVYKEYKAKRPKADEELVAQLIRSRDVLEAFGIPRYEAPGFEADDCIATIVKRAPKNIDIVIASGDMDTMQLIDDARVTVYTLRKGLNDTVLYDEKAVIERYGFPPEAIPDYKGFAGDPSDNIIGVPGIGAKTATMLITKFGSMDGAYKALKKDREKFIGAGFSERIANLLTEHEDEAEFSKVLATTRDDAPIQFAVPEKQFIEGLDVARLTELFTDLGFRTLVPRVRSLANGEEKPAGVSQSGTPAGPTAKQKDTATRSLLFGGEDASAAADPLYKEAAVMLWLTNSEITNPSVEDVLNNTKSKTVAEAHAKLLKEIEKDALTKVFEDIEKPLIPVIDDVNARGILVDPAYLKELSTEYHAELDALSKKIYAAAGEEFNINSPKQLGDILFVKLGIGNGNGKRQKKTATGQLSTRESELQKLKEENPIIENILAYRELQKLLGTYIDAIPPLLDANNRLHTTFVQTGTTTGRLSSKEPNLQNIPIKSDLGRRIRRAFMAPEGSSLLAFDYSQIELRLAAILSSDEKLQNIFKRGEDVHAAVAAEVFNVAEKEVTYEMRRRAKVINFGILYGMGVNALREALGTDRATAQDFYNRYFETFSGLAEYLSKTKASAARLGYTTTLFGRRRFFPGIKSRLPYVKAMAERMAINAPMQGTQSDMIKLAMVRIHALLSEKFSGKADIVLQIHDELLFEVENSSVDAVSAEVRRLMEGVLPEKETEGVPILVSGSKGQNWGEMEKLS